MADTHPNRPWRLAAYALLALTATQAAADVQIKTLEDGTKLISNETVVERSRRKAGHLVPVPQAEVQRHIDQYARFFGLSPRLVQAVVQTESGYNVRALSSKGAMGLMQLMPGTAAILGVADPYDPQQNIRGGTAYLRQQLDKFGSVSLALAAYNAGPGAVERHAGVPPYAETQGYVRKVMALYQAAPPPEGVTILASDQAQMRREVALKKAEVAARVAVPGPPPNKILVSRDASNQILFSNVPAQRPSLSAAAKSPSAPRKARPTNTSARLAPGAQR
jgi:hypothetical protein